MITFEEAYGLWKCCVYYGTFGELLITTQISISYSKEEEGEKKKSLKKQVRCLKTIERQSFNRMNEYKCNKCCGT